MDPDKGSLILNGGDEGDICSCTESSPDGVFRKLEPIGERLADNHVDLWREIPFRQDLDHDSGMPHVDPLPRKVTAIGYVGMYSPVNKKGRDHQFGAREGFFSDFVVYAYGGKGGEAA
jgi:hypothetical protein